MQLRKTISLVPFHFDVRMCLRALMDVPLLTPFYQKASSAIFKFSATPITWLLPEPTCRCAKFLLHKFKQLFTITRDVTTKEDALDETPGSHQRNYRIVCKVWRRIYLLTLTVHFPMAWASLALKFCCSDV